MTQKPKTSPIYLFIAIAPLFLSATVGAQVDATLKHSSATSKHGATLKEQVTKENINNLSKFEHSNNQVIQANLAVKLLKQGDQINFQGRTIEVPWSQWQGEDNQTRIGISDTAAEQILGIELLSSNNPALQPVAWFSEPTAAPLTLNTQYSGAYRYLDITTLAARAGWQLKIKGNTLIINSQQRKIEDISIDSSPWAEEVTVYLDGITSWQISQGKKEGIVTLDAMADASLWESFTQTHGDAEEEEEEIGEDLQGEEEGDEREEINTPPLFVLESAREGKQTKMKFPLSEGIGLAVGTLPNNRLIIQRKAETLRTRDIVWQPGINWHQQYITIEIEKKTSETLQEVEEITFPVFWLEIDRNSPNLAMKPIVPQSGAEGIAPLITTARNNEAAIAINGGFFNRNNKLPLGAVRQEGVWQSGPILNRGAIAWNQSGEIKFDRLRLEETITTATGETFPIQHLNSGYIKAGISRYTPAWGASYTTMIDNEIIVEVRNNLVVDKFTAETAGSESFAIPAEGYLLVLRSYQSAANKLELGTILDKMRRTIPADFIRYPNIIGAGPLLIQNSNIVLNAEVEKFTKAFQQQAAMRSAIAITDRNTLIIAAVHHRPGGRGPTLKELALVMEKMGATDALNLDGGSSTSLYLGGQLINRSPFTAARVHNGIGWFLK